MFDEIKFEFPVTAVKMSSVTSAAAEIASEATSIAASSSYETLLRRLTVISNMRDLLAP